MLQEILSSAAIVILGFIIKVIYSLNKKRKENQKIQSDKIDKLLAFQKQHLEETVQMNVGFDSMKKELIMNRVDARCAIYALRKASNGIKFDEYIEEERNRLMQEYNFKYRD